MPTGCSWSTPWRDELAAHGDEAALMSVMWANNEVGALQPLAEVVALAHRYGVPVHADAVQAVGQVPVDFGASGLDALTLTGHKVGGPGGAGALLARRGLELTPVQHGGGQERGVRSGTLDAALLASFATAVVGRRRGAGGVRAPGRRAAGRPGRRGARVRARRGAARSADRSAARERALHVRRLRGRLAPVPAGLRRRRGVDGLRVPGRRPAAQPRAARHGGRRARGARRAAVQPRAPSVAADVDALLACCPASSSGRAAAGLAAVS